MKTERSDLHQQSVEKVDAQPSDRALERFVPQLLQWLTSLHRVSAEITASSETKRFALVLETEPEELKRRSETDAMAAKAVTQTVQIASEFGYKAKMIGDFAAQPDIESGVGLRVKTEQFSKIGRVDLLVRLETSEAKLSNILDAEVGRVQRAVPSARAGAARVPLWKARDKSLGETPLQFVERIYGDSQSVSRAEIYRRDEGLYRALRHWESYHRATGLPPTRKRASKIRRG